MNETDTLSPPLTFDEATQLVVFLAERGHTQAAFAVAGAIAARAATVVAARAATVVAEERA